MKRRRLSGTAEERFRARLIPVQRREGMTPCLEWDGYRDPNGYGRFNAGSGPEPRYMLAHRFALELAEGPDARPALHACDNPPCCNAEHLRYGTHADNYADSRARGRHVYGERAVNAILTEKDVREIRRSARAGEGVSSIATRFPIVSTATVWAVVRGITWRHVVLTDDDESAATEAVAS